MFDLSKRHNINTVIITEGCIDDACVEPTKRLVGWGSRCRTADMVKQGISKHINYYKCDKFEECRGKCGLYN